jgi:hypothetical protein
MRGEVLGVVGNGAHIFIAGRQIDPHETLGVRNRTFLPQLVPDRKRVLDPARVQMIEIGGPIGDGRPAAHEAALSVFAGSLARNPLDFIAGSDGTAIKKVVPPATKITCRMGGRLQTEDLGCPPKFAEKRAPGQGTWFDTYPGRAASQCGLSYSISGGVRTADIPAGYAGAPESLAGKFRTFGSGLVALRRQSPLAIFQFPFRHPRDRFDSDGDRFAEQRFPVALFAMPEHFLRLI